MTQMSQAVANLKLNLAETRAREDQLDAMIRQFETQLARIPRQTMYGGTPLDLALSAMEEVEERLLHAQTTRRHLRSIKERAQAELEALELVQRVEEARANLAQLRSQGSGDTLDEDTQAQILQLGEYIAQYSKQAERAITAGSGGQSR